jgi:hypothetical protein
MIDNESPPGSWARELEKRRGIDRRQPIEYVLAAIRQRGCWEEAQALELEFLSLRAQLERQQQITHSQIG